MMILYENMLEGKLTDLQSSLKTYLFGIAQNLIFKIHRKEEVNSRHETKLSEHWMFQSQPADSLDYLLDKTTEIIRQLKEPCRSIIRFFYMEGMELNEIAEEMEYRSSSVVKSQKARCVKKMRALADE
jgi:RNA polymerase sigma factor (sigma-70 family)